MLNSIENISAPLNEKILDYAKGSTEREHLIKALKQVSTDYIEIPIIIGGKEIHTHDNGHILTPHGFDKLASYSKAGPKEVELAIKNSLKAKRQWNQIEWHERAKITLRIAELIAGKYRYLLNAATMLGQSKNAYQAEIDSASETIDFLRFNVAFASQIYQNQPASTNTQNNVMDFRPLEGFVFAVTPFNFTSIASNLALAPALMGNTTIWKPATTSVLSSYYLMKIYKEAGLPDGVINFLPGKGEIIGNVILCSENLAGIHFTGSNQTFNHLWHEVAINLRNYTSYPRVVGETGGKNFIFAHNSADINELATAIIRGGFEYQGQKCSAASRVYVPYSLWQELKELLVETTKQLKMGDVTDFSNFINAVIDEEAFDKIAGYINMAKHSGECQILCGGSSDKSAGYFISPTIIETNNPHSPLMTEEIFGPIVTVFVYNDNEYEETLELANITSPFGLTGAIFSHDKYATLKAQDILRFAAGNFYINDKPTGAVVGMQPFGGSRASGTNDKAGSFLNLIRWTNPRNIKENFTPPKDYRYPFMEG